MVDYKFGHTPVSVKGNLQLLFYAGLVTSKASKQTIITAIIQPSCEIVLVYETVTREDIERAWRVFDSNFKYRNEAKPKKVRGVTSAKLKQSAPRSGPK